MSLVSRIATVVKALRTASEKPVAPKIASLFAGTYGPAAGWWRDDPAEQLRNYQSWVYAAVNAVAQEVAKQKPYLFLNTGQAEHEQSPLPHSHPLCRLLDNPNPWMMFCEGTVQPKLDLMGQALTRDLGRRYGMDVAITFPDCSPRNLDQRRKDDELDAKLGLRTYNEIRRSRGLQPFADEKFNSPMLPSSVNG
ncbi:phage portal protein [Limnoglobus roseus]|uniref:Uncharacterized protein n=1 Tax=Limnoglobus roseus TaxID=2598579 RepID=A0A5C1A6G9_9BACT|nr:phage portal protein [Limnoglobus roseus]QEL14839.1 hypothetical protein PX52LOC_01737 [Limnoglobus roseus]